MKSVFFYGLFMDEDLLREKGCYPASCAIAYVEGYQLRIGSRATLVRSPRCRAYGLIADLNADDLNVLYSDPSVANYKPEAMVAFELSKTRREVISYLLPTESLSGTNAKYAVSLAEAASKLGLPQSYINEISTWASKDR